MEQPVLLQVGHPREDIRSLVQGNLSKGRGQCLRCTKRHMDTFQLRLCVDSPLLFGGRRVHSREYATSDLFCAINIRRTHANLTWFYGA